MGVANLTGTSTSGAISVKSSCTTVQTPIVVPGLDDVREGLHAMNVASLDEGTLRLAFVSWFRCLCG
jgi:hypothetical protein